MHIARRVSATFALTGAIALIAAGCGSSSTSTKATTTTTATHTQTTTTIASTDYCKKLQQLKQQALTINASQGINGLKTHAQAVQDHLNGLKSELSSEFTPEVNKVQSAVGKVKAAARELAKNPSASSISDATIGVKDLTTSVSELVTSAQATCSKS
jgi:membrane-bound lytic murein transglycosylase